MGALERRKRFIHLICQRRHDTVANLARDLEVSERTILRDIVVLGDIIPIYTQPGRYNGGVYIDKEYQPDRVFFTEQETNLLEKLISCLAEKSYSMISMPDLTALRAIFEKYKNSRGRNGDKP